MDFAPVIPGIKSFLKEHPLLSVSLCSAASLGLYFLYTYILPNTNKRIKNVPPTPVKTIELEHHADSVGHGLERVLTRYENKIDLTPKTGEQERTFLTCFSQFLGMQHEEDVNAEKKMVAELWQCLREEYMAHYLLFNQPSFNLPGEVQRRIASFLMCINNPSSFRSPREEFASSLLNYTIYLHNNQTRLLLPAKGQFTNDKKYYVVKGESSVSIYDVATKEIIKEIVGNNRFILLKDRNIVVCYRGEKYIQERKEIRFYDIENDICVPYLDIDYKFKKLKVSRDGNYIFGCSGTNIFLCDIHDLKNIHKVEAQYESILDIALSDDNALYAVNTSDGIRLLKFDGTLHEVAAYQGDDLGCCDIRFLNNNTCLMATHSSRGLQMCLNLQITQYCNGEVTMKKSFNSGKYAAYWHQRASGSGKKIGDKIFIYEQRNADPDNQAYDPVVTITTVAGDVLHQIKGSLFRCALSEDEKHISLACDNNDHKNILLHLSDGPHFLSQQPVSADSTHHPYWTKFNPQSSLMAQSGSEDNWSKIFITDFNGVTVKVLGGSPENWRFGDNFDDPVSGYHIAFREVNFHHQGNGVIYKNTMHELYPVGADCCWKDKTAEMNIAQYCAMQKIGSAIGVINKNKDIARANKWLEYVAKEKAEKKERNRELLAQYVAGSLMQAD